MKKLLFTSLILSSVFTSFAQGIYVGAPGYAFDDFNSAKEYRDIIGSDNSLGIFLSPDTFNNSVNYYKRDIYGAPLILKDGVLKSSKTRIGNGVVSYEVSQPYGYLNLTPQVNVNFGEGKTINLTGSSSLTLIVGLKMDLASLATTYSGVKIKFAIKDANGILIDSKGANGGTTSQWKDEIYVTVDKTGSFRVSADLPIGTISIDNSTHPGITYLKIDFNNFNNKIGYEVVYPVLTEEEYVINENCSGNIKGDEGVMGASKPITGFDATKVAGFQMTFVESRQLPADCYFNATLADFKFDFTGFILGETPSSSFQMDSDPLGFTNSDELNSSKLIAYPNPIKNGNLNFNTDIENIKVYDAMGNEVFVANIASKINVDGFAKGLYVIKSSKGSTRFVVE